MLVPSQVLLELLELLPELLELLELLPELLELLEMLQLSAAGAAA